MFKYIMVFAIIDMYLFPIICMIAKTWLLKMLIVSIIVIQVLMLVSIKFTIAIAMVVEIVINSSFINLFLNHNIILLLPLTHLVISMFNYSHKRLSINFKVLPLY